MAGEMIAMLNGLGSSRSGFHGLGDVAANANAAFDELNSALNTAQGISQGVDQVMAAASGKSVGRTFGRPTQLIQSSMSIDDLRAAARRANPILARGAVNASGQLLYTNLPPTQGTDWSVYALPAGILLAAIGAAWYLTREKAL